MWLIIVLESGRRERRTGRLGFLLVESLLYLCQKRYACGPYYIQLVLRRLPRERSLVEIHISCHTRLYDEASAPFEAGHDVYYCEHGLRFSMADPRQCYDWLFAGS